MVIPCPKETVSNLHLFQSNFKGSPTSSSWMLGFLSKPETSRNFLYFSSPIFLANNKVPTFEDLIKISSTLKFFGNSLISEMLYFEHLIDLGIFSIIVSGFTKSFSKAIATVKVLKLILVHKRLGNLICIFFVIKI